ncbi:hypothetical protein DDE18_14490 [Nocardioides gansuensis]|uniref:AMP-binding enzyme C-terminal domain-containing protein n=1 Tax=Nocardioides gansuensis TaxID=2138300 RepID=A0A2T8F8W1_9ACTN|nr:hypothetical protein DDE18_14490 [Nocardioides gansuensis]
MRGRRDEDGRGGAGAGRRFPRRPRPGEHRAPGVPPGSHRDADGYYYYVVDRLKDLVIRGGYNVYPREVEEALYEHPDVVEAAVVGKPDERLGEEVVAFVALRQGSTATADDITAHCKQRLTAYKYPRELHVLPELPKGATGKILKRELRSQA